MPSELDQMSPAMGNEPSGEVVGGHGEPDREGAMAKADLYKLANYSMKLFKQIQDEDQLEGWVQAKITKAADYVASVYHYLEYEMKFSEYGDHLANAEVYSESQRAVLKNKLMEAKEKMKALKIKQADKVSEAMVIGGGKEETCQECGGSGVIMSQGKVVPAHVHDKVEKYKRLTKATHAAHKRIDANKNGIPDDEEVEEGFEAGTKPGTERKTATGTHTKTATGSVHKNTSYADGADDDVAQRSGKGKKSHAKSMSADEKKAQAPKLKQSPKSAKTWGMKDSEKFDNRDKVAEGAKPDFLDMDKDGDKKEPMKKAVADKKAGPKKGVNPFAKKVDENKKEPEGTYSSKRQETDGQRIARLAKEKRQAQNKERMKNDYNAEMEREGIEEGKPSAGLTKAQKSATVKDAKAGKDIGKPGKSFDKVAKAAGGGEKGTKIAAAAMWKNKAKSTVKEAIAKAKAKKDYDGDGKVESGKDEHAGSVDKAIKASKAKETVKESTEFDRMKTLMTRLLG